MEQNLCRLLRSVSCVSLSTQLLALVHLLSRCYAPATYPKCRRQNTTATSCTIDTHALADIPGYFLSVVIQAHPGLLAEHQVIHKNFTYTLHAAGGYYVKLQCQEYTE